MSSDRLPAEVCQYLAIILGIMLLEDFPCTMICSMVLHVFVGCLGIGPKSCRLRVLNKNVALSEVLRAGVGMAAVDILPFSSLLGQGLSSLPFSPYRAC